MAEDFLGEAFGVDVGGVKEIDARVEADVDQASGFGNVAGAPGFEEFGAAPERAGAETENGNLEAGMAKLSELHAGWMRCGMRRIQVRGGGETSSRGCGTGS